jgi:ankyrin repeat protein
MQLKNCCYSFMKHWRYIIMSLSLLIAGIFCSYGQDEIYDSLGLSQDEDLIIAADKGDTAAVLKLIRKGAHVNAKTFAGVTPLMYAAQNGDTTVAKLLIQHGADMGLRPLNGYTALISAIRNGNLTMAEFLIRHGADINQPDYDGVTPFMYAIAADSFYLPDMLLYYKADVNRQNKQGMNALMTASYLGRYEIVVSILESGAAVNAADKQQWTPLHYATLAGNTDIMELLLVNGAGLEAATSTGYTPLSVAAAVNNFGAARLLIGYGADVNSRINGSVNPLTLALENKNDSLARMLKNHEARVVPGPSFNQYFTGAHWRVNDDDSHLGFTVGMGDQKYNLMASISYGFRLSAIQVLEQTENKVFYQYWERRHFIALAVEKAVYLPTDFKYFKTGVYGGVSEVLTFGRYRGSSENPDVRLLFNPRIGAILEFGFLRGKFSYEFLDLHLRDISTQWFNLSLEFLFNKNRGKMKLPSPDWL